MFAVSCIFVCIHTSYECSQAPSMHELRTLCSFSPRRKKRIWCLSHPCVHAIALYSVTMNFLWIQAVNRLNFFSISSVQVWESAVTDTLDVCVLFAWVKNGRENLAYVCMCCFLSLLGFAYKLDGGRLCTLHFVEWLVKEEKRSKDRQLQAERGETERQWESALSSNFIFTQF